MLLNLLIWSNKIVLSSAKVVYKYKKKCTSNSLPNVNIYQTNLLDTKTIAFLLICGPQ